MTNNTNVVIEQKNTFTLIRQKNGIAHLVMDVVGESMNTLKAEFGEQISNMLKESVMIKLL